MQELQEAEHVTGVDASELGVAQARENAALNGLEDRVEFICEDVFDLLPRLEKQGEKYDVVILDPPAFTKSRSSIKKAVKGYREINLRGMKLVKDGGYLATCSCSHLWIMNCLPRRSGRQRRMCIRGCGRWSSEHRRRIIRYCGERGILII